MFNGILLMLEVPSHALFDPNRPSESLADSLDFIAQKYWHKKISSFVYVKPVVTYIQDSIKFVREHDFLQKFNTLEINDKLIDVINLEVFYIIS